VIYLLFDRLAFYVGSKSVPDSPPALP
jgi:hypothetical protein